MMNIILGRPKTLLTFIILLTLALSVPFSKTKIDNGLKVLYEQGNHQDKVNKEIKKVFGNVDELVVLAYRSDDLFSYKELNFIKSVQSALEGIDGIKSCYSIVNIPYFWNEKDNESQELITHSRAFLEEIPRSREELLKLKQTATSNPMYVRNLISKDGNVAGFNIIFADNLNSIQKEGIVKKIIKIYKSFDRNDRFYLTGMHVFMESAGRFMARDILIFTSILVVLMFIIMMILFKNVMASMAILLTAGICNILTIGTISLLGMKISIATTSIPAIITALCLAYSIHIFCTKIETIKEVLVSNFLAIVTSMLGFSSMIFSPMPTVSQLGIYLVMGSFYSLITTIMFATPIKLIFFKNLPENRAIINFSQILYRFVRENKTMVYIGSFVLFAIGFKLFGMKLDTNYYKYFREKSEIVKHVDFVNQNLSGQYPIVIKIDNPKGIKNVETLNYIKGLSEYAKKIKNVDKVVSFNTVLNEGQKAFEDDFSPFWFHDLRAVEEVSMLVEGQDDLLLGYYLSPSETSSLVLIRTKSISSLDFKDILEKVRSYTKIKILESAKISIGGTYINTVESADRMSISQLRSSFLAIISILIIVFLFVRNFKLMFFAGIANLLPIFSIYGILGIMREPLNMGTAIIAAISFGLAVDDTIHFITRYKYALRRSNNIDQAIKSVFIHGVSSITFTTIVIGVGFLSLSLSSFTPIYQLGLYTSITMLLCFLIDVMLLPRMLYDSERSYLLEVRGSNA